MLILPDVFSVFDDFGIDHGYLEYCGPRPLCDHEGLAISIFKWRRIVVELNQFNLYHDGDVDTCGLCLLYNLPSKRILDDTCLECLIFKETGKTFCEGTHYYDYVRAYDNDDYEKALVAVKGELAFLEGLWSKLEDHED